MKRPNFRRKILKQSHGAEKLKKGRPFVLFETPVCCKFMVEPLGDKSKFRKKSHSAKTFKGGPYSLVRLYFTLKVEEMKGGPSALTQMRFRLPVQYFSSSVKSVHYAYIV